MGRVKKCTSTGLVIDYCLSTNDEKILGDFRESVLAHFLLLTILITTKTKEVVFTKTK